jgi:hypothetical protein
MGEAVHEDAFLVTTAYKYVVKVIRRLVSASAILAVMNTE